MRKIIIIFLLFCTNLNASNFKLEKIVEGFERPWSLSFIDDQRLLITEKTWKY